MPPIEKEIQEALDQVQELWRGWQCPLCGAILSPYTQTCSVDHRHLVPANEVSKYQATLRALREAGDGLVEVIISVLEDNGYSTSHDAIKAWYKAQGV